MSSNGEIIHVPTTYDILFKPWRNDVNSHNHRDNEDDMNSITSHINFDDDFMCNHRLNQDHININQPFGNSFDPLFRSDPLSPKQHESSLTPLSAGNGGAGVVDLVEFHNPAHIGNNRFMVQISLHRDRFQEAFKQKNTQICNDIIYMIIRVVCEKCEPKGRFLEMFTSDWDGSNSWKDLGTGIAVKDRIERILLNPPDTPITAVLEGRGDSNIQKESKMQVVDLRTPSRHDSQRQESTLSGDLGQKIMSPLFGIEDTQPAYQPDEFPQKNLPIPSLDNDLNIQNQFGFHLAPNQAFDPDAFQPRAEVESSYEESTITSTNPSISNFSVPTVQSSASTIGSIKDRRGRNRHRWNRGGPPKGIQRQGKISSAGTAQITNGMMNQVKLESCSSEMTESIYSYHSSEHNIPFFSTAANSIPNGPSIFSPELPLSSSITQELFLDLEKIQVLTIRKTIDHVNAYDVLCESDPISIKSISSPGFVGNNRIRIMMQMHEQAYCRGSFDQRLRIKHEIYSNVTNSLKGQGRFLMKNTESDYIEEGNFQKCLEIIQKCLNDLAESSKKSKTSQTKGSDMFGGMRHRLNACQALQSKNKKKKQKFMGAHQREKMQRKMMDVAKQEKKMLHTSKEVGCDVSNNSGNQHL